MQTDDTLILANDRFADFEENELVKVKLMFKSREKLTIFISIKFNDEVISRNDKNDSLLLNQSKQFDQIRLIHLSSIDLINSRNQIRKSMTSKNQYVTQRVRSAYIAILSQSKVSFDLSVAAQIINSKEKNAKRLNKRLQ
jgi:hypothetical protein